MASHGETIEEYSKFIHNAFKNADHQWPSVLEDTNINTLICVDPAMDSLLKDGIIEPTKTWRTPGAQLYLLRKDGPFGIRGNKIKPFLQNREGENVILGAHLECGAGLIGFGKMTIASQEHLIQDANGEIERMAQLIGVAVTFLPEIDHGSAAPFMH